MPPVARKDVVTSGPGEKNFDPILTSQPADKEHVERGGIRLRFVQVIHHLLEFTCHFGSDFDSAQIHIKVISNSPGIGQIIHHAFFTQGTASEIDRETLESGMRVFTGKSNN